MLGHRLSFLAETCDHRRLAPGTKKEAEWTDPENPDVTRLVETTRNRRQDISLLDGLSRENFDSTPETWGVGPGHLEVSETLAPDLSRFCMRVLGGEEYNFFNSVKLWVQCLTRESWDWWPLRQSFRPLLQDEIRIQWYCVSHHSRPFNPDMLIRQRIWGTHIGQ